MQQPQLEYPHYTDETFPLEKITDFYQYREVQPRVVDQIAEIIITEGFYPDGYVYIAQYGECYELFAGNHRYEAAKRTGLSTLPALIYPDLPYDAKLRIALQTNDNTKVFAKDTFVNHVQLIWKELKKPDMTQQKLAEIFPKNWGSKRISQLAKLERKQHKKTKRWSGLSKSAWNVVSTTFKENGRTLKNAVVDNNSTTVENVFTERLLRDILPLKPCRQLELVQNLADGNITKGKFKTRAQNYRARETVFWHCRQHLGKTKFKWRRRYHQAIFTTPAYDQEGKNLLHLKDEEEIKIPKINTLIDMIKKLIQQEESIQLIHGDFYEEVKNIGDESVDLGILDPPFNVSSEREFTFKDEHGNKKRENLSQDFGEWDHYESQEFIALFAIWAQELYRIFKPHASGYIFCGYAYYSHLKEALEAVGFKVHIPVFWKKTNPAMQITQRTYCNTAEQIVFFTKGTEYPFNWQGQNEMHNVIECPICQGEERRKDVNGNTLHPTQKPEVLIRHLMEISSNIGDMVFDGFMGVGTTPAVSKKLGRQCIGIEQKEVFFLDTQERINEIEYE